MTWPMFFLYFCIWFQYFSVAVDKKKSYHFLSFVIKSSNSSKQRKKMLLVTKELTCPNRVVMMSDAF